MGAWNNLPNELASTILHYLDKRIGWPTDHHQSNKDIVHCTTVSHQFRTIVEPMLYREVHLSAEWQDDDDPHRQLRQFTRTITSRPELGLLVKHLHGSDLNGEDDDSHELEEFSELCSGTVGVNEIGELLETMNNEARSDIQFLLMHVERKGLPNGLLLHGGTHGLLILLLHQLEALQTLSLETRNTLPVAAFASLGYFIGGIPTGLRSLKQASVFYEDTEASAKQKHNCQLADTSLTPFHFSLDSMQQL